MRGDCRSGVSRCSGLAVPRGLLTAEGVEDADAGCWVGKAQGVERDFGCACRPRALASGSWRLQAQMEADRICSLVVAIWSVRSGLHIVGK